MLMLLPATACALLYTPLLPATTTPRVAPAVQMNRAFAKSKPTSDSARRLKKATATKWDRPGWLPEVSNSEGEEISDGATAVRWIGVQGAIDLSIVALFCYNCCGGNLAEFTLEDAVSHPELKFLILMPAITVFFQILRRFAPEQDEIRNFDNDPIVAYLGGPTKIRNLRDRYNEAELNLT